jgi:hypothetical protein
LAELDDPPPGEPFHHKMLRQDREREDNLLRAGERRERASALDMDGAAKVRRFQRAKLAARRKANEVLEEFR